MRCAGEPSSSKSCTPGRCVWPWITRLGLGRLPGDIFIQREGFTFYAPIATGILISLVLSLILWLWPR